MSDLAWTLIVLLAWVQGFSVAYVFWGTRTPFWAGFVRGLTFGIVRIKR